MTIRAMSFVCLLPALACGSGPGRPARAEDTSEATTPPGLSTGPVQIEMRNVRLHVADGIVLSVRYLRGEMLSRKPGTPPVFDDTRSYTLQLDTADISIDMPSLTRLMNDHVLGYDGAPLRDVTVDIDDGRLRQKGTLKKLIPIPFSTKASVAATADGRLQLRTESVRSFGVPTTTLLDLFGLELDDLVNLKRARGVEVIGDDLIIDPGAVLPPPTMRGHLARAEIVGDELQQVFASPGHKAPAPLSPPDSQARNYIYFSGSSIRFGKLTMSGADLQLIDSDGRDPFDFFPARYNRQLVAGHSKNTPQGGLKTYMPDYGDLPRR